MRKHLQNLALVGLSCAFVVALFTIPPWLVALWLSSNAALVFYLAHRPHPTDHIHV